MHPSRPLILLVLAALGAALPAHGQVTAAPESLRVVIVQGQEATAAVTLFNASGEPFPYCLDVLRPGQPHHAPGSLGAGCGPPGELLLRRTPQPGYVVSDPYSFTMTPDGLLLAADRRSGFTAEYTAALDYVRHYPHPRVAQLTPFTQTRGVTYDERTGRLWWLNMEVSGLEVRRTMLLEGTTGGVATGQRLTLQVPTGNAPAPYFAGGVYEPAAGRYYLLDVRTGVAAALWAVDTVGAVVSGYPLALQRYPDAEEGNGLDVHGGEHGASEVRLEVPVAVGGEAYWSRVVVTDPLGRDLGLETPIPAFPAGWRAGLYGGVLRSRLDPNGVMYGSFVGFDANNASVEGLFAWRPVPLAPSWLALTTWMGTVEGGASAEVTLTFRAGDRTPGEYRSTLVVEDAAGAVLASVPLVLVVEETTPAEPGPEPGAVSLSVAPNPSRGAATVTLTLPEGGAVRVGVYDVLGRTVAVLHAGPLGAGTHALAVPPLAPGAYVVRARAGAGTAARRLVVAR